MMTPTGGVIIVVSVWAVMIMINMVMQNFTHSVDMNIIIENQEAIIQFLNSTETTP